MRCFAIVIVVVFLTTEFGDAKRKTYLNTSNKCKCKGSTAKCSGLRYIPAFSKNITDVVFTRNTFHILSRNFISNLTAIPLRSLMFSSNQILHIEEDSFTDLKFLKTFGISNEQNLTSGVIRKAVSAMTSSLNAVYFLDNGWESVPDNMFFTPATQNVSIVDLSRNRLLDFSFESLIGLHQLTHLNLSANKLIEIKINRTVQLHNLNIEQNDVVRLSSFCKSSSDETHTSYFPKLRTLNLGENALSDISQRTFMCLPSLKSLILNKNRFHYIPSNFLVGLPSVTELQIKHILQPNGIKKNAFRSPSLQKLNLGENGFKFETKRFNIGNIFQHVPKLKHLDLTDSFLPKSSMLLMKMFIPIRNLKSLNLLSSNLHELPVEFVQMFTSLETLILQGNAITFLENGTFENMTKLKHLNIEGNTIKVLQKGAIPLQILTNLETLDLSNNPFSCTCEMKWFRDWLRDKNKSRPIMKNFPFRYKCTYPDNMQGTLLVNYNPTTKNCRPWNPLITMAITLGSFIVIVFLAIISAYRCNANVRNWLYLLRLRKLKRKGYLRLDSREEFEYDAFVVYCDADSTWVHTEFLQKLENKDIRFCIRFRDFEPGKAITDNIDTFFGKCWKVVIIMSNDFAENEWSQWETDFVQERRRQQGKDALILIMLKTIDSKHMTSPITTMIKTTPYLSYVKGVGENLFWRTVAESIKRPLSNPPIAV